jgi:eukaryotic-like serine/threonine-protein kinase
VTDTGPAATLTTRFGGRYVLLDELGRGGMATVHRAYDEVLERAVAIKILHPQLATDPTFLDRFRREARAAAALNHPNVVTVYDWGEAEGGAYLVLQLVEGTTLRTVLSTHGSLDTREAATIVEAAARGLDAAHSIGLVHRDVKPENVLLGIDGIVRITDFGLARAAATASTTFGTGVLVGSPHYVAPEAVRGEALDPRADVYALGIVLFECLVGRPPHQGDTPYATALAHTERAVAAPSQLRDDVDPALDEVVGWATAIDRDHRYADARDFARALANAVPDPVTLDHLVVTPRDRASAPVVHPSSTDVTAVVGGANPRRHDDRPHPSSSPRIVGPAAGARTVAASAVGGYLLWEQVLAPVADVPLVIGSDPEARNHAVVRRRICCRHSRHTGTRSRHPRRPRDRARSDGHGARRCDRIADFVSRAAHGRCAPHRGDRCNRCSARTRSPTRT